VAEAGGGAIRDRLRVVFSFILIFAFSSIDSAISPMVESLHLYFGVPLDSVLLLISSATTGIVLGVIAGPALTASLRVSRLLAAGTVGLVVTHALFLLAPGFQLALGCRFLFGLCSGTIASVMWWLTFYGVSKEYYPAMIAVLLSARPLATAIGVPAVGLAAARWGWKPPLWALGGLILVAGAGLWCFMPRESEPKRPFDVRRVLGEYRDALVVPYASPYYAGMVVNRMCYFGFYAFSGIWFIRHYGLTLEKISLCLLIIGLAEALVNFSVPALIRRFGHGRMFTSSMLVSAAVLPFFISGRLPLVSAVALITVFMLLDRVYSMAAVISIPQMFPSTGNRTAFGTLNTLAAWIGLTLISWFESRYTEALGLDVIQYVLIVCFLAGSALLYYVQYDTVLKPAAAGRSPLATDRS